MKRIFNTVLALALVALIAACGGKKKETRRPAYVDPRMDQSMQRSALDTSAVIQLATHYLDKLKANDIEGALNQLYELKDSGVVKISETRKNELRHTLQAFPVLDYKIDQMALYSNTDTEVRYTITLFEKPEGDQRPNTITGVMNPVKTDDGWFLTVSKVTEEGNFKEENNEEESEE